MNHETQIESMHPLEIKTLRAFSNIATMGIEQLEQETRLDAARIRRALEWLVTRKALEVVSETHRLFVNLTDAGRECARNKITELRIIDAARQGVTLKDLQSGGLFDAAELGPAVGSLKKQAILSFGEGGCLKVSDNTDLCELLSMQQTIENWVDRNETAFEDIPESERMRIEELAKKRGKSQSMFKISERVFRTYRLTEAGELILRDVMERGLTGEEEGRVLPEHLKDGKWKTLSYRRYALDLAPPRIVVGKRNPYREFLDYVKEKLIALGFEQMVGDHVVPEFWNMDALFMPQFHAARDIHDVYFVKEPMLADHIEEPYLSNVAAVHTDGGHTGSTGWGYTFDREQSLRLLLRSQGTALSARTLSRAKVPGKYFGMARCFRYDSVDATHAPDFFQVEGITLAPENNFRTLLGLLKLFAKELAKADDIMFVPGYFPFTEPSVEAHIKHKTLGWIEMGGAGIFRPEVTGPQGVDVPVIAWGLGLDRMAMVAMGIDDIRDLFATDLNKIRSTIAGFDR
ncbi:phenylalanine--tRNA ligase subunit alpha [bacterium]|nr:phenylalanine--tRNA ligase subunit alpha [candidate division CSSED10-310 bacterium]